MVPAFITLLLAAHLLCVNVASGGPLIGAWLDWRGTKGDELAAKAAVYLARVASVGFVAGAVLGLMIGWLKWDESYSALWNGPLDYKLRWAVIEAVFSLLLMLVWWRWLPGKAGGGRTAMKIRGLIAVLASTNLLYHFPALFTIAARMHGAETQVTESLRGAAFRSLMFTAETAALVIHVTLASLAVAGFVLLWFAARPASADTEAAHAKLARQAGWWALLPSLAQLPVGLWTLVSLSPAAQNNIMGETTLGTLLLVSSLAAALWLMNDLVQIALGEPTRSLVRRAGVALLVTVVLMTAMQQQTRTFNGPDFILQSRQP